MTNENPFMAPRAVVADVAGGSDEGFAPVAMFSAKGRIGRLRYLAYIMGSYLIFGLVVAILSLGGLALAGTGSSDAGVGTMVILGVVYVAYMAYFVIVTIKRSHDMNWSGWMSLLVLIPFVGLIWMFKSGSPARNDYGLPPPPNTLGVKVLAWILPAIFVVGIVAAIALPAYQDYTKRAAALSGSSR